MRQNISSMKDTYIYNLLFYDKGDTKGWKKRMVIFIHGTELIKNLDGNESKP